MKKIGILASYNGSGFETIQKAIEDGILDAKVEVIITNNSDAGVLKKASKYGIKSFVINKNIVKIRYNRIFKNVKIKNKKE